MSFDSSVSRFRKLNEAVVNAKRVTLRDNLPKRLGSKAAEGNPVADEAGVAVEPKGKAYLKGSPQPGWDKNPLFTQSN